MLHGISKLQVNILFLLTRYLATLDLSPATLGWHTNVNKLSKMLISVKYDNSSVSGNDWVQLRLVGVVSRVESKQVLHETAHNKVCGLS